MDRVPVILANALLVVSVVGLVLLAVQYWSPMPQLASDEPVALTPYSNSSSRTLAVRAAEQPDPLSEDELDLDAEAPNDQPAVEVGSPFGAPLIIGSDGVATGDDIAVAWPPSSVPVSPTEIAVAWTTVPPRPARPQLAPAPAAVIPTEADQQALEPTVAGGLPSRLVADGGDAEDAALAADSSDDSPDPEPDWRESPWFRGDAGADNLHVARVMGEILANLPRREELSRRERERTWNDGLRWRNVFTDHLGPDR